MEIILKKNWRQYSNTEVVNSVETDLNNVLNNSQNTYVEWEYGEEIEIKEKEER